MTFDDITGDGRLWAVKYDGDHDNILAMTFERWNDLPYRIINYLKLFWVKKKPKVIDREDTTHGFDCMQSDFRKTLI